MNTFYTHLIETLIREVVSEDLDSVDEMTDSSATPGYETPHAFARDPKSKGRTDLLRGGYTVIEPSR